MVKRTGPTMFLSCLALLVAAWAVDPGRSSAQDPAPPGQAPGKVQSTDVIEKTIGSPPPVGAQTTYLQWIRNGAVQKDLKLTEDQKKKIAAFDKDRYAKGDELEQMRKENVKALPRPNEVPPEQRRAMLVELAEEKRAKIDALNLEFEARYLKVLTPAQRQRLFEIKLHIRGPYAFAEEDVIRRFNIDHVQVGLINEILEGSRQELEAATTIRVPRDGDLSANKGYQEQVAAAIKTGSDIRASMTRRITKLLRKKQWDAYQAMMSEPFETARLFDGTRRAIPKKTKASGDGEASPVKTDATIPATPVPERKSLRESRGTGKPEP
jgi:Spy/CpxP family protein refolding chaperone